MSQWNQQLQSEFESRLVELIEGVATPETKRNINDTMGQFAAARDLYLQMMALHAQLHAHHGEESFHDNAPQPAATQSRWQHVKALALRPTPLSIGIAAASIAGLLALLAVVGPPVYRAVSGIDGGRVESAPQGLAQITGLHEAVMRAGRVRRGTNLRPGETLELESGLVEIRCHTGERIIAHGPCSLSVAANSNGAKHSTVFLESGRLTAIVPKQAIGFTVETPSARVVDLGTEFGVLVREGETEVHVISGKVQAKSIVAKSATELAAGEALQFHRDSDVPVKIAIAKAEFTRQLPSDPSKQDPYITAVLRDRPIALWRLNDRGTSLAFNSAGRPHGMYRGDVTFGGDVRPGSRSTHTSSFDGARDYVEIEYNEQFQGEDFTLEAWVNMDSPPVDYASILTSRNDTPRTSGYILYVSNTSHCEFWTGDGGNWTRLEGPVLERRSWTYVAATFQRIHTAPNSLLSGIARLYVNGELVAQRDDMNYVPLREFSRPLRIAAGGTESPTPRYWFNGQVADVAIYQRALRAEEIHRHYDSAVQQREE